MNDKYILNDKGEPMPEDNILAWATWFENSRETRRVAVDIIGNSRVSTVFVGLNHALGDEPPVLWETMVFDGKLDQDQDRCSGTREQAEAMHAKMVQRVREAEGV